MLLLRTRLGENLKNKKAADMWIMIIFAIVIIIAAFVILNIFDSNVRQKAGKSISDTMKRGTDGISSALDGLKGGIGGSGSGQVQTGGTFTNVLADGTEQTVKIFDPVMGEFIYGIKIFVGPPRPNNKAEFVTTYIQKTGEAKSTGYAGDTISLSISEEKCFVSGLCIKLISVDTTTNKVTFDIYTSGTIIFKEITKCVKSSESYCTIYDTTIGKQVSINTMIANWQNYCSDIIKYNSDPNLALSCDQTTQLRMLTDKKEIAPFSICVNKNVPNTAIICFGYCKQNPNNNDPCAFFQ